MYCKTIWVKRNLKKIERKKVTSNSLYLYFLSQLKIRILADFDTIRNGKYPVFLLKSLIDSQIYIQ
jgi:hypothetical protein